MTKIRVFLFFLTILVVATAGLIASYYARGYRFNTDSISFEPKGLLVANSEPTGAQVFVNAELRSATNATITLSPGIYDVEVKKDSYLTWKKRLSVEKEIVTQIDVSLFLSTPSLSAFTFSGAMSPQLSPDRTKIAYAIPFSGSPAEDTSKAGLWLAETVALPLGFSREPRRITDGNMEGSTWEFSPDSQQILLTGKFGSFLLETGRFTPQNQRINIASQITSIRSAWEEERKEKVESKLVKLQDDIEDIFLRKGKDIELSPDENKILYEASGSATIPEDLVPQLPGASTQHQERDIKSGHIYVYDIKEDRNFEIADNNKVIIYWLPGGSHLLQPEDGKITIMDYDGTNRQTVYSGSYIYPNAFPYANAAKILILTNLGSQTGIPNLYSLNLK